MSTRFITLSTRMFCTFEHQGRTNSHIHLMVRRTLQSTYPNVMFGHFRQKHIIL